MFRKLSSTASSLAMAVSSKKSSSQPLSDTTRPDPILWQPTPGSGPLAFGPGPVPQFVSRKATNFKVTHVPAVGFFYAHPDRADIHEHLETLLADLRSFGNATRVKMTSTGLSWDEVRVNGHYGMRSADEDFFYRCEVLEKLENGMLKVFFLDYGNYEFIPPSHLFSMPPELENRRIYLQCLVMKGLEPLFEEHCDGNNFRTELLDWFRDRVLEQTVIAANVEDDTKCLIFLDRCNINEEVKRKVEELSLKHRLYDSKKPAKPAVAAPVTTTAQVNGVLQNSTLTSPPASRSCFEARRLEAVVEAKVPPSSSPLPPRVDVLDRGRAIPRTFSAPITTIVEMSSEESSEFSLIGDVFETIKKAQESVKSKRRAEKAKKDFRALVYRISDFIQNETHHEDAGRTKAINEIDKVVQNLENLVKDHEQDIGRTSQASALFSEGIKTLRKGVRLVVQDMKTLSCRTKTSRDQLTELYNLWKQHEGDHFSLDAKQNVAESDTDILVLLNKYKTWCDERDHLLLDAQVATRKALADFSEIVSKALDHLVDDDHDLHPDEKEPSRKPILPKALDESMSKFTNAAEEEKKLLKSCDPPFMADLTFAISDRLEANFQASAGNASFMDQILRTHEDQEDSNDCD